MQGWHGSNGVCIESGREVRNSHVIQDGIEVREIWDDFEKSCRHPWRSRWDNKVSCDSYGY